MLKILVIALIMCNLNIFSTSSELPSNYKRCARGEPTFDDCLRDAMEDAIKKLANGNKGLSILPLEPIVISSATIKEGAGAVHVVQKFTNLNIHKITKSTITSVRSTHTNNKLLIMANATAPEYVLEADYDFNGRLLVLPIVGVGKSKITLSNVNTIWTYSGQYIIKNGQQYIDVETFKLILLPEKVHYRFDNLFNGNKVLSDQIHTVLNENWKQVFDDVKEGYEELLSTIGKAFTVQIFSKIPTKDIFLK